MTELVAIFAELGISQYLHEFLEQGFDTWETILDITESDFDALGVKRGHRRRLQRKIANSRGLSADRALSSPRIAPSEDRIEEAKPSEVRSDVQVAPGNAYHGAPHGAKRKYRRHPKPDDNAPERPPSAYVIFSNKMREELKGRNLSFTEIAKLVGENWQNLSPAEKEPYEQQAFSAKEIYNNQLAEYKKTDEYKEYSQYLIDFKAKHSSTQQSETSPDVNMVKRPKLEGILSTGTGTGISSTNQQSITSANIRARVGSTGSVKSQWHSADTHVPPQISIMPKLTMDVGASKVQSSSKTTAPIILPGYRDSIFNGSPQSLPWREAPLEDSLPPLSISLSITDGRVAGVGGFEEHTRRTDLSHPPPLLTSESTNRSTSSSLSTVSSSYFTPRTPLDQHLERVLPISSPYPQKPSFENQLPPLRAPSLSPQSTISGALRSPTGIRLWGDFPSPIPSIRAHGTTLSHPASQVESEAKYQNLMTCDENLDSLSVLLRAGEILNQSSRNRH